MRSSPLRSEAGFTLIELVVVALIIGILSAIALPAFTGQRGKANDAEAKAALRNAQEAIQVHFATFDTYSVSPDVLRSEEPALEQAPASTERVLNPAGCA